MSVFHKYTLMCDEVRQENNGKFMILGLYTPNIAVPQLPFVLPSLTFFQWLEVDRLGSYTLRIQLQNLETGRVLAQTVVMMDVQQAPTLPTAALNIAKFGNVQVERAGAYSLNMSIDGQGDPITIPFDVILNIPRPVPQQAAFPQR